jgi:membrane fusion protein, multidrug efflux system
MKARIPGRCPIMATETKSAEPRRSLWRPLLLWVAPAVLIAVAVVFWYFGRGYASTDNAYVKADRTTVAAEVDGTVKNVPVKENAHVAAGDVLIELDDEQLRYAVQSAKARVDAVKAQIAGLKAQYAEKGTELAVAQRSADFAKREQTRQQELAAKHLVALSKLDDADQATQIAVGQVQVTERDLAAIAARLGGDPKRSVNSHPDVEAAVAELQHAELDLRRARILAPRTGIVSHLPQVGDHLTAGGPALAIVSDQGMWIEANFKETDLAHVRKGQAVRIEIDTYGRRKWSGRVDSIAQATGAEFAILPPQNASGNWVKVVQRIPVRIAVLTTAEDPPLRAGMSATVRVDTNSEPDQAVARTALAAP